MQDPVAAIKACKIPVTIERALDSAMSEENFLMGFTAMSAMARRHWLADIASDKFKIRKLANDERLVDAEGVPRAEAASDETELPRPAADPASAPSLLNGEPASGPSLLNGAGVTSD